MHFGFIFMKRPPLVLYVVWGELALVNMVRCSSRSVRVARPCFAPERPRPVSEGCFHGFSFTGGEAGKQ